jgi:LacI family transcriptional regulator
MAEIPKIALLIRTTRAYGRGLLRGIANYLQSKGPWSIYYDGHVLRNGLPPWTRRWKADGIIGWLESPRLVREIARGPYQGAAGVW